MPCGISLPYHVSSDTLRLEKREIPTISESNEIRRGSSISRDDFNGKVRFVIQDLEKFWIFTKITILPIFEKIGFSRGFTLLEVGFSPYLGFIPIFSTFRMFRLIEALNGRLIGPKAWDRIDLIYGTHCEQLVTVRGCLGL